MKAHGAGIRGGFLCSLCFRLCYWLHSIRPLLQLGRSQDPPWKRIAQFQQIVIARDQGIGASLSGKGEKYAIIRITAAWPFAASYFDDLCEGEKIAQQLVYFRTTEPKLRICQHTQQLRDSFRANQRSQRTSSP